MINKEDLKAIYGDFFHATTLNPLVSLKRVCKTLDLDENEARRAIKQYLFSLTSESNMSEAVFTNSAGFKLLHIYSIESRTNMPKSLNDLPVSNNNKKGEY